ncbi:MAG: putative quinol monooxygenase [Bacteroidales bacterium]
MKKINLLLLFVCCLFAACSSTGISTNGMLVRTSEIEVDPNYLEEYKAILIEKAAASVRLEKGVLAIFPMQEKSNPCRVRILEIYQSQEAYEEHLKTPHFQKYKATTLNMVKSLQLIDMTAMDSTTMDLMFAKLNDPEIYRYGGNKTLILNM